MTTFTFCRFSRHALSYGIRRAITGATTDERRTLRRWLVSISKVEADGTFELRTTPKQARLAAACLAYVQVCDRSAYIDDMHWEMIQFGESEG